MRYRVIIHVDTWQYASDKQHVASFTHEQHAIGFCEKLVVDAYVLDCFDDTIIYRN